MCGVTLWHDFNRARTPVLTLHCTRQSVQVQNLQILHNMQVTIRKVVNLTPLLGHVYLGRYVTFFVVFKVQRRRQPGEVKA